mmetsp:Transcript_5398/g.7758  ORF Transcript_5398/g.7758 Transcript_5398/m.7758 type:complete len:410 (-) Transcript_5398:2017-3246(-)
MSNEAPSLGEVAVLISDVTCYWNANSEESTKSSNAHGNTTVESCHETKANTNNNQELPSNDGPSDSEPNSGAVVALQNINLELRMGELCCIIGPVGSGKSTLLHSIAGELLPSCGLIERNYSSLAYASQDPWIMDGTVKQNIIMGLSFNPDWYDEVISACGLKIDFTQLLNGDETIVGDRGVQCSGGQRARIGLARALYRDTDVLLLDDPLSAVDSKVGRLIFYSAIQDLAVKRGKCVVLVTHQHQFIGDSKCLLLTKGMVECFGAYDDCVAASGGTLTTTLQNHKTSDDELCMVDQVVINKPAPADMSLDKSNGDDRTEEDKLSHKEMSKIGVVTGSTFVNYARAMGSVWIGIGMLLFFTITQATYLLEIALFGKWGVMPVEEQVSTDHQHVLLALCCTIFIQLICSI